ncbi:unnamed protein product [Dicrocoelium dendriticum]|nr:unnamed protein product [Dicrocoelium dendriticum]
MIDAESSIILLCVECCSVVTAVNSISVPKYGKLQLYAARPCSTMTTEHRPAAPKDPLLTDESVCHLVLVVSLLLHCSRFGARAEAEAEEANANVDANRKCWPSDVVVQSCSGDMYTR